MLTHVSSSSTSISFFDFLCVFGARIILLIFEAGPTECGTSLDSDVKQSSPSRRLTRDLPSIMEKVNDTLPLIDMTTINDKFDDFESRMWKKMKMNQNL